MLPGMTPSNCIIEAQYLETNRRDNAPAKHTPSFSSFSEADWADLQPRLRILFLPIEGKSLSGRTVPDG